MSTVNYFADGCELLRKDSPNMQSIWLCMFNPTKRDAGVVMMLYYEDIDPTQLRLTVPAKTKRNFHLSEYNEVVKDKHYGARILSTEPIVVQPAVGYYGPDDKHDWYTRASYWTIASTALSKVWYFADGVVIDVPDRRLKESEWVFVLKPNKEATQVTLNVYYNDQTEDVFRCNVPAERLKAIFLDDIVTKNKGYGVRIVSGEPIAVQETRRIWEEDRRVTRSAMSTMAFPWPLHWGDDIDEIL